MSDYNKGFLSAIACIEALKDNVGCKDCRHFNLVKIKCGEGIDFETMFGRKCPLFEVPTKEDAQCP